MSKRNGRVHKGPEILVHSDPDTVSLVQAIGERINTVFDTYRRTRGMDLAVPDSLQPDMLRFIAMADRHQHGDFRNYPSEAKAARTVAQWSVTVYRALRGQKDEKIQWRE
jgi:hypothetical protein